MVLPSTRIGAARGCPEPGDQRSPGLRADVREPRGIEASAGDVVDAGDLVEHQRLVETADAGGVVEVGVLDVLRELERESGGEEATERVAGDRELLRQHPAGDPLLHLVAKRLVLALVPRRAQGEHVDDVGDDVVDVARPADREDALAGRDVLEDGGGETVAFGERAVGLAGVGVVGPVGFGAVVVLVDQLPSEANRSACSVAKSASVSCSRWI